MRLSLILPVYNNCTELQRNFMPIYKELKKMGSFEIIIAEDGSDDGSREAAIKFARMPNVRILSDKRRLGKGGAIKKGIGAAKGDTVGYIDIDLAIPLRYLRKAVEKVEEGNVIVLGSRYAKGADSSRSRHRLFESLFYNYMMEFFLGSKIKDHQCGFKFWNGRYIRRAIRDVRDSYWFFDSEILVRAQRKGVVPYEMPVEWHEGRNTKVKTADIPYFFNSIMKLRSELA